MRIELPDDERRERTPGQRYSVEPWAAIILHKKPATHELANHNRALRRATCQRQLEIARLHDALSGGDLQRGALIGARPAAGDQSINRRINQPVRDKCEVLHSHETFKVVSQPVHEELTPCDRSFARQVVCRFERGVVTVAVVAKHRSRIHRSVSRHRVEPVPPQHRVGEEARNSAITVGKRMDPDESVVGNRRVEHLFVHGHVAIGEVEQLRHFRLHIHMRLRSVCGLTNHHLVRSVLARSSVSLANEPLNGDSMKLPDGDMRQWLRRSVASTKSMPPDSFLSSVCPEQIVLRGIRKMTNPQSNTTDTPDDLRPNVEHGATQRSHQLPRRHAGGPEARARRHAPANAPSLTPPVMPCPQPRHVAHAVRRDAHPVLVQRTMVIPSYTLVMKTAISVPDDTFRRVDERAAALGMSRSEFYSRAAEGFLERLDSQSRVEAINDALARSSVRAASDAASIGQVGLERIETLTRDDEW